LRIAREDSEALSILIPAAVTAAADDDDILVELGVYTAIPPAAMFEAATGLVGGGEEMTPLLGARLSPAFAGELMRPLPVLGWTGDVESIR
jgi:hypothetical protein